MALSLLVLALLGTIVAGEKDLFLIVYAGPSSAEHYEKLHKGKLYHDNFMFFLEHGLKCELDVNALYDVVITLSEYQNEMYTKLLAGYIRSSKCNSFRIVVVKNQCYDMGDVRDGLLSVDSNIYDYVVVLNCGVIGPFIPVHTQNDKYWPRYFTAALNKEVKLTGISVNCGSQPPRIPHAHIQSMLWVTDRVGYKVISASSALYDCAQNWTKVNQTKISGPEWVHLINEYELGLSNAVITAGYSIRAINQYQRDLVYNKENNTLQPFNSRCVDLFWGDIATHVPISPFDFIFHKNSRGTATKEVKFYSRLSRNVSENLPPPPK